MAGNLAQESAHEQAGPQCCRVSGTLSCPSRAPSRAGKPDASKEMQCEPCWGKDPFQLGCQWAIPVGAGLEEIRSLEDGEWDYGMMAQRPEYTRSTSEGLRAPGSNRTGHRTFSTSPATHGHLPTIEPWLYFCPHLPFYPLPQPPIPLTNACVWHHYTGGDGSKPISHSRCKFLMCIHHVPDTTRGTVHSTRHTAGQREPSCLICSGKELLRVRSLFPTPSQVPTLLSLSAEGRNRWVQPESKCPPPGLSVAEIGMRQ